MTTSMPIGVPIPTALPIRRTVILGAAMALCAINGLAGAIILAVERTGFVDALSSLFNISAIVWIAVVCGIALGLSPAAEDRDDPLQSRDIVVLALATILILAPSGTLGWFALTVVAGWTLLTSERRLARAAAILLAVTMPMCWTRLLFSFAAKQILAADAELTAILLGTTATGNLIQFPGGQGYFQIYPACSSLGNVSLAILGWMIAVNLFGRGSWRHDLFWGLMACCSVIAINILRLTAIGAYPQHFDLIHGTVGNTVTGWLSLIAITMVSWAGLRNVELPNDGTPTPIGHGLRALPSVAASVLLVITILSVGTKLALEAAPDIRDPVALRRAIGERLIKNGLRVTEIQGTPELMLVAERDTCRIVLVEARTQGWNDALIRQMKGEDDSLRFIYRGASYAELPLFRSTWQYQTARIARQIGGAGFAWHPVLAVLSSPACSNEMSALGAPLAL
ncbi:exosortase/archaeosortase family protein [Methylorubrum sp. POS3]|uniref:exosortase/archaeosortase family protein n=1 Tax=Methylorubrum sp. POS3 TaxID=2998492 RepID=UPI003729D8CD